MYLVAASYRFCTFPTEPALPIYPILHTGTVYNMYLVDSPDPVLFLLIQPFHFLLYMHCTVTSLNPVLVPSDLVFFFPPILYLASLNPVQFLLVQIRLFPMQYCTVYCTLPLILSVFILIQILSFSYSICSTVRTLLLLRILASRSFY